MASYRWHIEDAMPFRDSINVTIEHGHANGHEADYSSVAFYYMTGRTSPNPPLPNDPKELLASPPVAAIKIPDAIEGESLVETAKATGGSVSVQKMHAYAGNWSGDAQLWWRPEKAGETLTLEIPVERAGEYEVTGYFCKAPDYGMFEVQIGGAIQVVDLYSANIASSGPVSLGRAKLEAGKNVMTIITAGKADASTNYLVGIDAIGIK